MKTAVTTWDATESLKEALSDWPTRFLAERAGTNARTVENWKSGNNGPSWSLVVRLLNDDELAPVVLRAAGRSDLANTDEVIGKIRAMERAVRSFDHADVVDVIPTLQAEVEAEPRRPPAPSRAERIGARARAASLGKAR